MLPPGLIFNEVDKAASAMLKAAESQDTVLRLLNDRLLGSSSFSAEYLMSTSKTLNRDVSLANEALQRIQPVVDIRSNDTHGFVGRLFMTDAHLVRLVQSDVDPYLAAVRLAYLQPGEMAAELDSAERCLTSF